MIFSVSASAQEGIIAPSSTPAKVTPVMEAPQADALTSEKQALSQDLKNTHGMADDLLAQATKLASVGSEEDKARLGKVMESIKMVQSNLSGELSNVASANAENSAEVLGKAKETNESGMTTLASLKEQLMPEKK